MSTAAKIFAGPGMLVAGINHFANPRVYEPLMPDYLPAHRELIFLSGVAEILAGAGSMVPATRSKAGLLSIATLIAIFPANVWMVQRPERFKKIPRWAAIARLPLQLWMIKAVWDTTRKPSG
ncbi:MAG: hypothetical protein JWO02_3260 [Solirubrobacterales bacterium]|nr:hypothetical protein [Solirubrobacterales bacterium]